MEQKEWNLGLDLGLSRADYCEKEDKTGGIKGRNNK